MNCDRAQELMIDALVQTLDSAELEELRAHIDSCEGCAERAADIKGLWSSLETVAVPEPSPGSEARLMAAVAEEFAAEMTPTTPTRRPSLIRTGWLAAAALALVAIGSLLTIGTQSLLDRGVDSSIAGKSRYMLIMTEMDEASQANDQAQEEFYEWITDLIDRGVMETGIGLADLPAVGTPPGGNLVDPTVSGVIVIYAEDDEEARQIAASSPVLAYGGFIEIRELSGNDSEE